VHAARKAFYGAFYGCPAVAARLVRLLKRRFTVGR
jgi:hypothetical protein